MALLWSNPSKSVSISADGRHPEESSSGPGLSNQRVAAVFEYSTVPSLSPHLSVAPASCPGRARCCGLCYQPSAVAGAHPQRWAMTETAGPQGGPPPSAGRGPWSEAFRERRWRGRWRLIRLSAKDTHWSQVELKSKHSMGHFVLQSPNHCNESDCGETEMKAAQRGRVLAIQELP